MTASKVTPFDAEKLFASIAIIGIYVGQIPGPESPCIVSFPSADVTVEVFTGGSIDTALSTIGWDTIG